MQLSSPLERLGRYLAAAWIDFRLFLAGKTDPDLPPLRLRYVGDGDYRAVGVELARVVLDHAHLHPTSRLLDIGCGVGRVAMPLTRLLPPGAVYEGFDVVRGAVRWCNRRIGRRHPGFRFRHVPVRSPEYSLGGVSAAEFRFPYPDASFDCAFAFSVFTHFTLVELRRYLEETRRVLSPGGTLIATFFLLNEDSIPRLESLPPLYRFPVVDGPTRFADRANPALAVAVEESVLLAEMASAGFRDPTVLRGQWAGHPEARTFQDLVVCGR